MRFIAAPSTGKIEDKNRSTHSHVTQLRTGGAFYWGVEVTFTLCLFYFLLQGLLTRKLLGCFLCLPLGPQSVLFGQFRLRQVVNDSGAESIADDVYWGTDSIPVTQYETKVKDFVRSRSLQGPRLISFNWAPRLSMDRAGQHFPS